MPAKGHKAVRNMVATSGDESIQTVLDKFNKLYKVCSHCKGKGFIVDDETVDILPGVSTIKYKGNEALEELDNLGELTGDVLKNVIEVMSHGGEHCTKCNGFKFVKKSRKKKNGTKN